MARKYPAFGIPADFEPEFPSVLCNPSTPAINLSLGSADGISLLSNPDLYERIIRLLNAHTSVRTEHFEPCAILRPCFQAAVLDFNDAIADPPVYVDEWSLWYDHLGLFTP